MKPQQRLEKKCHGHHHSGGKVTCKLSISSQIFNFEQASHHEERYQAVSLNVEVLDALPNLSDVLQMMSTKSVSVVMNVA